MRTFNAFVDKSAKKVVCDKDTIHVPGHFYEEIAVCLKSPWLKKYELKVNVTKDPHKCVETQTLNTSTVVIKDNNQKPGEIKFEVALEPLPSSRAEKVEPLDPIIVNED
jgi:hypothetical protein